MDSIELFLATPPLSAASEPIRAAVPERYRAELFRPELEHARTTFMSVARRHSRVRPALERKALIDALALILDDYVAPAVVADVNTFEARWFPGEPITHQMYERYVAACLQHAADPYRISVDLTIQAPSPPTLPWRGLDAFYRRYPQVRWMVTTMASQYEQNILRCCERVLEDWPDIQTFFFMPELPSPSDPRLTSLSQIQTTGSDFHKGGGQVLLLSFRDTASATRRLVYKPSDVERDFRAVGNTEALTAAIGGNPTLTVVTHKGVTRSNLLNNQAGNQGKSLAEMITTLGANQQLEIPTYKILPVHPGSSLPVQDRDHVSIRESYGYLEFLSSTEADNRMQDDPQVARYYRSFGAAVAMAYVFQVTDLHQENLIVHDRLPYLIDLEMAYTGIMARPNNTNLSDAYSKFKVGIMQRVVQGWGSKSLIYGVEGKEEPTKNRVLTADGVLRPPTSTDNNALRAGFGETMKLVAHNQNAFDIWITSGKRMVTRILPFGTDLLLGQLRALNDQSSPRIAVTFPPEVVLKSQRNGSIEVKGWGNAFHDTVSRNNLDTAQRLAHQYNGIAPKYAFWFAPQTADDFIHGDVPAYYQKMSTGQALDSKGHFIRVPFDLGIHHTTPSDQQDLAARLITLWGTTTPLYPEQYFTGPVFETLRTYLRQLNADPQLFRERMDAALNDLLRW